MNFRNLTLASACTGAVLALCSSQASAAEILAALDVDRVTVYQDGAVVTRSGAVDIPAGAHRLSILGLPSAIETKGLHVVIENSSVLMGGIEVERINEGKFVSDIEGELRRRVEQKTDLRTAVQDEVATAQLQLKLLESVAASPFAATTRSTVDGASLGSVLHTLGTSSATARKRVRDANLLKRELDREIEKLTSDLAKIATQSKQSTRIHASIEAKAAVTAIVSVSYSVNAASWHWIYEARLDTAKKQLTLERQGQVQQGSGEDWRNVELTLTTALPSEDVATPRVGSLFVELQVPRPKLASLSLRDSAMAAAPIAEALDAVSVTGNRSAARVQATDFLADYKVSGRITVLADREPRLYPIANDAFDVELVARVVPSVGRSAHLEALFDYRRAVPLDSGELQLYRDGAYVGSAVTPALLPGALVRIPFGADERIRVNVEDETAKSVERGVLNKEFVHESRRRFDVTSYHADPITVEVVDRIPVSKLADVRVDTLKGATSPTETDLGGKAGVLLWRFAAVTQKTVSIRHYYSIEYPKDRQILETEGDASE